jgi:hypothetical protein
LNRSQRCPRKAGSSPRFLVIQLMKSDFGSVGGAAFQS